MDNLRIAMIMRDAEGIFYELPMFQVIRIIFKALGFHTPIYHSAIKKFTLGWIGRQVDKQMKVDELTNSRR